MWMAAEKGDRLKSKYQHLVGRPATELVRTYRAPDDVERVAPLVVDMATGKIIQRVDPYVVYKYYPWPTLGDFMPTKVFIDDKTETITRIKAPLE